MAIRTKTIAVAAFAFALGLGISGFAKSDMPVNYKIAFVDVSTVISHSTEVLALKKEQEVKLNELQQWLGTAKADIAKQTTKEDKEKLLKKYDAEFIKKQKAIKDSNTLKLQEIDKNISKIIANEAKSQGYNIVLNKTSVLYGGDDITQSVALKVK